MTEKRSQKSPALVISTFEDQALNINQSNIGADAAAALEHLPHGNRPCKVWFPVVGNVYRHWQVQTLLVLDAAVADPLASVPQPIWRVVELRLRRLEVERQIIVCASGAKGLGACQFSSQWRGGEEGRAIWDGGSGGCCRHNVVIGVNRREARRYCKVWLLLLRLRLFLLTAIILGWGRSGRWEAERTEKRKTTFVSMHISIKNV